MSRWNYPTAVRMIRAAAQRKRAMQLADQGLRSSAIERRLGLSRRTVNRYLREERELGISGFYEDGSPY
jgi:DNA-binding transcriptional regulator LsrR (DeoR family)